MSSLSLAVVGLMPMPAGVPLPQSAPSKGTQVHTSGSATIGSPPPPAPPEPPWEPPAPAVAALAAAGSSSLQPTSHASASAPKTTEREVMRPA
jgi:hypothetical protein